MNLVLMIIVVILVRMKLRNFIRIVYALKMNMKIVPIELVNPVYHCVRNAKIIQNVPYV